ncbi:MAG: M48 family metallopeptidase [Proteobacteria bacterium]|nr:M48 family metallopeptidase [Pseudomonadota bacterium]
MSRSRIKTPSVQLLKVDGLPAPVEVRRHPRARRLTLRVSHAARAVVLTIPRHTDFREADRFLAKSLDWVRERLEGVPEPVPFEDRAMVPLRGVPHHVIFAGPSRGAPVVRVVDAAESEHPSLIVAGAKEHAPRRLGDWLAAEARRDLEDRVAVHATALKLKARRITLRDQKSRWGSCSSDGRLSFSWRLVLAPPHVLDYVAAHEVAHLAEMNHGPRFWKLVKQAMPRLEEAKLWLRIHGRTLYRYGISEAE